MSYPHSFWRLLITGPSDGAWNMAVDEALLEAMGQDQNRPILRLYAWEPPCVSIGYAQQSNDIDLQRLNELEWGWVRRPTGGRAILHTDELTYSVIAPLNEPRVFGSVLESYQRLSTALMAALRLLGISAESQPSTMPDNGRSRAAVCFEVPSNYEIVVQGKKLIGSAQARRREGILQHGTLPLWGDLSRITQALRFPDEAERIAANIRLLAHATTVETTLGYKISWDTAAQAFAAGFQSELGLEWVQSELTPQEKKRTVDLVREKYSHPSWLSRI